MTRLILLVVLALVIVRALRMLVRGVIVGAGGTSSSRPSRQSPGQAVKLSRDPVCGTHVSPRSALSISSGGTTYYFCSEKCRDTFRSRG